jgi:hypothetical protein
MGRGAEPLQEGEDGGVLDARAQHAFQVRVDLGKQAAEADADAGGLAGQVVVEADEHPQLGDGLVFELDRAQCVWHDAGLRSR